jgi:aspartate aminotransferase
MATTYDEFINRRKCLIDGLNKIPGVYSPIPMGAFYTMVQLPIDDCDKFCQWCLTDFRRNGETIMMAPGTGFYSDSSLGKNQVRLAYVLNNQDLKKALKLLEEALEEYNNLTK